MNDSSSKSTEKEPMTRHMTGQTKRRTVRLSDLKMNTDRYCHRQHEELDEKVLEPLMDSLVLEGLRQPVTIYTDSQGNEILIGGHRRVSGLRFLARRNQSGFSEDMEIEAIEIIGATAQDHLVQSVSDNENRKNLSPAERLRTTKRLHDAGVEVRRAARALGVSDSTYQRDLGLVKHPWMYQHIEDDSVAHTVADKLIVAATKAGRLKELKEDLDAWVADKKRELKDKARRYKAETGKDIKPSELMVKNKMPKFLIDHWLNLIKEGRRFDDEAEWDFAGSIDGGRLQIPSVSMDITKTSAENLAKLAARLSQLIKQITPLALEKYQLEQSRKVNAGPVAPWDFSLLREWGMVETATKLEERFNRQMAETVDGEEAPDHFAEGERDEHDLAADMELPGQEEDGEATEAPGAGASAVEMPSVSPPATPVSEASAAAPAADAVPAAAKKRESAQAVKKGANKS